MIFSVELEGTAGRHSVFVDDAKKLQQIVDTKDATLQLDRHRFQPHKGVRAYPGPGPIDGFTITRRGVTIRGYRELG